MARRSRVGLFAVLTLLVLGLPGWWIYGQVSAWRSLRAAREALEKDDSKAAQDHLAHCTTIWPSSGEVRFLAARAARRSGDLAAGMRLLDEAKERDWPEEAIALERALLRAQGGELAQVEGYLRHCLENDHPDAAFILEVVAPLALKGFRLGQANEDAQGWVRLRPNSAAAWRCQGQVAEKRQDRDLAIESFREVVRLEPGRREDRQALARLLLDAHRPMEARPILEGLLREAPEDHEAGLGLARCLHIMGQRDSVRDLLIDLARARPDHAGVWHLRARLELAEGKPDLALKFARRAAELEPYEPDILFTWLQCLQRVGSPEQIRAVSERLAKVRADLGKLPDLTRQVMARPSDPEPRRQVGEIYLRNGKETEGLRWLHSALDADSTHRATHTALATFFEEKGDHRRAAEHYRSARRK